MYHPKFKKLLAVILLLVLVFTIPSAAVGYIPTNRDTRMPPEPMTFEIKTPQDFVLLYETDNLKFYYREDRDVIAIYDKRNGYTWKTGLDVPFSRDIDARIKEALGKGETPVYEPKEDKLNTTFTQMANSLITIEYYDETFNIKRTSSAPYGGDSSELKKFADDYYRLDIDFKDVDISMKVHIYFDDNGVRYEIKDDEIQGQDTDILAAVMISPFLGASGGVQLLWSEEEQDYAIYRPKGMIPGYVLVPDGSGALIRFQDNHTRLQAYVGDVYGPDPSHATYYYSYDYGFVPFKHPKMPVFGIAHGDRQNAFVAYAIEGAEFMEIVVTPEENLTHYTWAYPRFVYNIFYHQVYNRKGDGYFTLLKERNHFDVNIRYDFLQGDGSSGEPPANYVGMALRYREYLLENDIIREKPFDIERIPIRLDFVMADAKRSILGFEDVVVTTAQQVGEILNDVYSRGILRINSGLLGFQKGGITLGKPWKVSWNRNIGSRKDFEQVIENARDKGIDISFAQNYTYINKEQMTLPNNAAKHANGWLNEYTYSRFTSFPIQEITYAKPLKSVEWLNKQVDTFKKLDVASLTIDGISNMLLSDYSKKGNNVQEAIKLYQDTLSQYADDYTINAVSPNAYLWKYVDRFLDTPVFSTQYIIETDNVPFLQLVLNGTMELYAPYSNFSFYTDKDVLRMIDYNVYPSFLLSNESSHYLASTNSANLYSTEYNLYRDLIVETYEKVNDSLGKVINCRWIDREVLDDGIVLNTYDNGTQILINYTENPYYFRNTTIDALSYYVFQQEV